MKYFLILLLSSFLILNSHNLYAEDALTIKQQLDRIVEEVKDLNKAVFNKSFEQNDVNLTENNTDTDRFTSIDIRIYDLEKDIKNLTLQFEEILFKIDDLSIDINSLQTNLISKVEINNNNLELSKDEKFQEPKINTENTLGNLIISDNIQISNFTESETIDEKNKDEKIKQELDILSAEEQLQFALDQMMKKKYDRSKDVLEDFIVKFPENQLSGSAHFWLGKIYLFELNFRKAAIVFGEGVQKFPKSIKAAEMYYELAKSLKEMDKNPEACKTLSLLEENHKGNKFARDPEKIKTKLNCELNN